LSDSVRVSLAHPDNDIPVGTLWFHQRSAGSATFAYDTAYVSERGAFAIDPLLTLATGSFHTPTTRAMFGAFTDIAPDRWGRRLMIREESVQAKVESRTPRTLSELDFIKGVSDVLRQGALRIRDSDDSTPLSPSPDGVPTLMQLGALLQASDDLENEEITDEQVKALVKAGGSLGGARPKAAVRDNRGKLWIAKFPRPSTDEWDVIAWERVAYELAARAGIRVPTTRLIPLGNRRVLLLERFDRNGEVRVHYASAMTLLEGWDSDPRTRSYLEVGETIETESPNASVDLAELWTRIVFSILISNTDDHLRNHGFLRESSGWRLSPAFDLNPDPEPGEKHLQLAINETDTAAEIDLARSVAPLFRLSDSQAQEITARVQGVVDGWEGVAESFDLSRKELRRMEPAFASTR
jgi:serine/threonine-protein kinase HipA